MFKWLVCVASGQTDHGLALVPGNPSVTAAGAPMDSDVEIAKDNSGSIEGRVKGCGPVPKAVQLRWRVMLAKCQ